jgi:outer membrane protein assembly factor BamB
VFVDTPHTTVAAFSANGTTGCATTTSKVCKPLWKAVVGYIGTSPVAAYGYVYIAGGNSVVHAFSGNASAGCTGSFPSVTCNPLFKTTTSGSAISANPSIAGGVLYREFGGALHASQAKPSAACTGSPVPVCPDLVSVANAGGYYGAPAISDGKVFVNGGNGHLVALGP